MRDILETELLNQCLEKFKINETTPKPMLRRRIV